MMVETKDYKGNERRNGGKLKLSMREYLKLIIIAVTLLVSGVTAWLTLNSNVKALADDSEENTENLEVLEKENDEQDDKIKEMQGDIKYIRKEVDEFKEVQHTQIMLLYQIKGKLDE